MRSFLEWEPSFFCFPLSADGEGVGEFDGVGFCCSFYDIFLAQLEGGTGDEAGTGLEIEGNGVGGKGFACGVALFVGFVNADGLVLFYVQSDGEDGAACDLDGCEVAVQSFFRRTCLTPRQDFAAVDDDGGVLVLVVLRF